MSRFAVLLAIVATMMAAGCATRGKTTKLTAYRLDQGYRFGLLSQAMKEQDPRRNSDALFVILALSGGGTRSAAFSYGAFEQLRRVRFSVDPATGLPVRCKAGDAACQQQERSLLDEVDVISSVSGGSFTAAYYGLYRDDLFNPNGRFHRRFLYHPVQRDLFAQAVYYPQNWRFLGSRAEIAAAYYAKHIFGPATFADLARQPRPFIVLNADDMSTGTRFEFTQEQFDPLCADLGVFPVARAVAASSAFPGLLNSVSLQSHARDGCGYMEPPWIGNALKDKQVNRERYLSARQARAYADPARAYLHLLDGGLADNIGLRGVLQALWNSDLPVQDAPPGSTAPNNDAGTLVGGWSVLQRINNGTVKRIIVITVNARTNKAEDWDRRARGPGTISVLGATSGTPMGNFSTETIKLLGDTLDERREDLALKGFGDQAVFGVEVAFEDIADDEERRFFQHLGTNFQLTTTEVDCLIDRGAELLRDALALNQAQRARTFTTFVEQELHATMTKPPTLIDRSACRLASLSSSSSSRSPSPSRSPAPRAGAAGGRP